ncbi:MAG: hypothetical protein Q9211_001524 [Gyalolechia sp. 1 TL-2023]
MSHDISGRFCSGHFFDQTPPDLDAATIGGIQTQGVGTDIKVRVSGEEVAEQGSVVVVCGALQEELLGVEAIMAATGVVATWIENSRLVAEEKEDCDLDIAILSACIEKGLFMLDKQTVDMGEKCVRRTVRIFDMEGKSCSIKSRSGRR